MIKNFKKSLNKISKFIIAFLVIIFSFLSYLSIPALYEYDSLQKELSKKTLEEFNLNLSLCYPLEVKTLSLNSKTSIAFIASKTLNRSMMIY